MLFCCVLTVLTTAETAINPGTREADALVVKLNMLHDIHSRDVYSKNTYVSDIFLDDANTGL